MSWYSHEWSPYVPVAERRRKARKKMEAMRKKGVDIQPIEIVGRKIAKSFWGEAWCTHLEAYSDFENRLPRGRTYVRNGSVCHLALSKGRVEAKVSGSELYTVKVSIKTLPAAKWKSLKGRCSGRIGSLLELLEGKLSDHVMGVVTDRTDGLFPSPKEISFECSCPDWASMCKHVAAVLYGVGARLDAKPELLFLLRGVDHEELIAADAEKAVAAATSRGKSKRLAAADVGAVFGIELEPAAAAAPTANANRPAPGLPAEPATRRRKTTTPTKAGKKLSKKKAVRKRTPTQNKAATSSRKRSRKERIANRTAGDTPTPLRIE